MERLGGISYAPRVCLLLLIVCLVGCAPSDDVWDHVQETGVLRIGMDASFPPFESIAADGTLIGFDVDLAQELGRRLGVEVEIVANLPYDGLYDALWVGRVDAVISALLVNPDRMADFAYSKPYLDAGQVLVVAEGGEGTEIKQMADLSGQTLAVEFGSQGDLEARIRARRLENMLVLTCETAADALAAVAEGEADAALVDHVSALGAVARLGEGRPGPGTRLAVVGQPVIPEPYAIAVRRKSQRILRAIDEALAEMEADGTLSALSARWLHQGSAAPAASPACDPRPAACGSGPRPRAA